MKNGLKKRLVLVGGDHVISKGGMVVKFSDLLTHVKTVDAYEVRKLLEERPEGSYTLLDVREPAEYEQGHIPGATLISLSELPDRLSEIDSQKPVLAY